ncbi:hypothetical protein BH24ACT8_BH24ACT8_15510 [soil metagenome]
MTGEPGGDPVSRVRVLSLPAGHRYVAHLADPDGADGVVRLDDPQVPGAGPGVWWPSPALGPAWLREHRADFDLVHLHFGFESRTTSQLADWVATLRSLRRPLVYTVHDLVNPNLVDQTAHRDLLDVLVPAADELITLTEGAAGQIRRDWGRTPDVVPHPHMVPLDLVAPQRPERHGVRDGLRVGVHLKSLRANTCPVPLLQALVTACRQVQGARLVVHAHRELRRPGFLRHDPALVDLLDRLEDRDDAAVAWVDRMDDRLLGDYLRGLDVLVLPHRWGTHSGWLEECRDLGTAVLAPDVGHFAEQGPVLSFRLRDGQPDLPSLERALRRATRTPPPGATRADRLEQRRLIAAAHRRVYRAALGRRP